MSVGETDADHPRFFVGCDDGEGDELLDPGRIVGYDCLYENVEEEEEHDEDEEYDSPPERQIVVGICAMSKKSKSKPMKEILERLCLFKYITVVTFEEDVILNEPVENWPLCDCLISFHSKGFPLDKAVAYEKLRNPFVINDLSLQYCIQDRREVYRILKEEGILLPRYAVLNRDPARPEECNLVEGEDHVEVNGEIFQKPFVEKPVSAEDHNVYIYYPTSAGGGSQRLFRKIGSRSSVYSPESNVRKTGSYIYEEFMPTDGTDVKVYTVGPDYAHAEARKSPALDGKVERDSEGKEVRYPVILNAREKLIAWKVCLAFKQTVCGFDLLRANGQSYVCDVNGFSFVKNSMKYYDDCAKILGNIVMRELAPQFQIPWSIPLEAEDIPIVPTTSGTMMELRCVIAVIRHGDRTPKQKMKMEVRHQRFFDLFEKCDGYKSGKLKLKKPKQLQEVLDIARQLLVELGQNNDSEIEESKAKLEQLKTVLEMYGHFSGINRKVQLTYLPHGCPKTSSEEDDVRRDDPSLLLVLKWGGELTPAGRVQAEELGRAFRCMYPGGQGDYAGFPGCGLLRLHSTYRHDLKIYASDEGRVQMTAAAFAKGLLALEGELTPILVQMVKSANMNGLLDSDSDSLNSCQQRVKARLHEILQKDRDFTAEDYEKLAPTSSTSLVKSMQMIKNPVKTCDKVYSLIQSLTLQIRQRMEDPKSADIQLYHSETLELMLRRWAKLEKDFKMKNGRYNISKIPDIYDCIKYDVQHNSSLKLDNTMEIYRLSKALADIVIPQEYGISQLEKLDIAKGYCTPLIRKIRSDLQRTQDDDTVNKLHPVYSRGVMSPERHVRTRLYFTSESHVHSLLSILRYGALCDETKDEQWKRAMDYLKVVSELNYMTQIVIMLYEDPNKDPSSEDRFHVELHFSPGAKGCEDEKNLPSGFGYRPASRENEGSKKKAQNDSDEESGSVKRDEPDRALMMFRPLVSDPIYIHRKSPLPRSKKIGSVEEESPLSVSSPDSIGTWIHYTCGVGTGRRRRRSGDQKTSSPVSPKSLAFTSSIFGSWQQVLSENNSHARTGRLHSEHKFTSGIGSHCAGLFSTMVLGGSSSAPNLQDYARAHRKKLTSSGFLDETTRGSAVKRFSISFARHPTNVFPSMFCGFELYSMVPSICPLETLHNSLSLKQVDEFLASIATSHDSIFETPTSSPASSLSYSAVPIKKAPLNTYTPAKVLPCPFTHSSSKKTLEKAATVSSESPTREHMVDCTDELLHGSTGNKVLQQHTLKDSGKQQNTSKEPKIPFDPAVSLNLSADITCGDEMQLKTTTRDDSKTKEPTEATALNNPGSKVSLQSTSNKKIDKVGSKGDMQASMHEIPESKLLLEASAHASLSCKVSVQDVCYSSTSDKSKAKTIGEVDQQLLQQDTPGNTQSIPDMAPSTAVAEVPLQTSSKDIMNDLAPQDTTSVASPDGTPSLATSQIRGIIQKPAKANME
ncbi:inositol hexakisphosphate and diphosphoinositol-pentakisphosphate kinase 2 isoform X2 [Scleropages formosus]|uniref:inositol hexakisphosphate and diphosphoinositol-pentakisphosphate kinase 2 isoform X2 n=1 Tax=Scleropages formosus TaxID=113540 RepID=UPI0010FAAC75|nr:inositol hexakisphosphate and diphosphoinositol-pentakisphosphate kinase 2 isoform X2 [Scleropages formosus]